MSPITGGKTMFFFWGSPSCSFDSYSRQTHLENKLKFLKMMRDNLETRLAGLNAAIETTERQLGREENS